MGSVDKDMSLGYLDSQEIGQEQEKLMTTVALESHAND